MCRLSRRSCAGLTGSARGLARLAGLVALLAVAMASPVRAQSPTPTPTPTTTPSPTPTPTPTVTPTPSPSPMPAPSPTQTMINADVSASSTVTNLGSNFLERLGNQASNGFNRMSRTNPGGGGASESTDGPVYRSWVEGYGISMTTGATGGYVGDTRTTWGGVAGIGARVAPGVNIGFSIDQSRTAIDVPLALQSATLDLTQFGFTASLDKGPWTWAVALVHGFGNINSSRDTGLGLATAGYNARLDGAISELSYYIDKDQSRLIPKGALEYVHTRTGSYQETGGLDPVSVTASSVDRMRLLLGAEVGHYWIFDQKILDLSAYGKFVDNVVQNFSNTTVSLAGQGLTLQGIGESQYGADAGAAASLSLTSTARIYLNYDAKFRAAMQSHQGTIGFEYKW
ncbi:autotransporter outer membrane beta-barrel domain-containing protein [Bradyrhizobium jicamae]|uniref:Autotransporter outer membrane beta-barrel domain-containing protein n=1 Tax=Bradyrhizobium jicamae TaxID=280332 RepID=A0ABS5FJ21_9BRAD|nr:autotransporter outer membrane beta-barrel domain-containing protein [Bradyrhizobium jicamae]MBR0796689.1 autotransporter outer membrane beta-barrel domain-containing protein [Bradyrhizobium jicamae]